MKVASIEKDNKRIIWLDFVKFIAISMMIAVHCTVLLQQNDQKHGITSGEVFMVHLCVLPYLCL